MADIPLDHISSQWLDMLEKAAGNGQVIAVPQKYFGVLKTWGFAEGTPGAAKLAPKGQGYILRQKLAATKETKSKKKRS